MNLRCRLLRCDGFLFAFGIFLFFLFPSSLSSQILKISSQPIWLSQQLSATVSPNIDTLSVGNYSLLDSEDSKFIKSCREISSKSKGTLFIVVKPKSDTLSDKKLLKMGAVSLYKDSITVDGTGVEIESIKDEPVLIEVKFQARPRRSWFSRSYKASNEIDVAEILFYDDLLTAEQLRKVETYFAIKYSIKINNLCTSEWPDYLSLHDYKLWNMNADENYSQQIMGLGRMDKADFFQSQSYSADSRSVKIALDSLNIIGENSNVSIQDSAILMLSQGSDLLQSQCGSNPADFLFKMRLFNWNSNAQALHIELDTVLHYNRVSISDGFNYIIIKDTVISGKTRFEVPLTNLIDDVNYFIVGMESPDTCNPLYDLQFYACDSVGQNGLVLSIDTAALPANCRLINLYTGQVFDTTAVLPLVTFSGMNAGSYELVATNDGGVILHSVFGFGDCVSSSNNVFMESFTQSNTKDVFGFDYINSNEGEGPFKDFKSSASGVGPEETSKVDLSPSKQISQEFDNTSPSINIFPNPIVRNGEVSVQFVGLDDLDFTIQIMDNKGAMLTEDKFVPSVTNSVYQHTIHQPGTFIVRVISSKYYSVQTVVVK